MPVTWSAAKPLVPGSDAGDGTPVFIVALTDSSESRRGARPLQGVVDSASKTALTLNRPASVLSRMARP